MSGKRLDQSFSNHIVSDREYNPVALVLIYLDFLNTHFPELAATFEINYNIDESDVEGVEWDLLELEETLEMISPIGHYFAASENDGSCFGFWVKASNSDTMTVMKNEDNTGLHVFYQCETDILYYNNPDEKLLWDEVKARITHELEMVEYILYIDEYGEVKVLCDENLNSYYKHWNI